LAGMTQRTKAKWWNRIRQWQESGLTSGEFAAGREFTAGGLRHFKSRLVREKARGKRRDRQAPPPFVEVVTAKGLVGLSSRPREDENPEPFEMLVGERVRIRIPLAFDPSALKRLVNALGEC
jgi:hypothetical protein